VDDPCQPRQGGIAAKVEGVDEDPERIDTTGDSMLATRL